MTVLIGRLYNVLMALDDEAGENAFGHKVVAVLKAQVVVVRAPFVGDLIDRQQLGARDSLALAIDWRGVRSKAQIWCSSSMPVARTLLPVDLV
ncbi:MAG: hypothetical protein R2932_22615 [Caldilineaceae bacterium]